jgi:hypothetical protein
MKPAGGEHKRWIVVIVFAAAMAWLEAAVVFYLRTLTDRVVPYQRNPLPMGGNLVQVELVREIATLVMLLTIGLLAGRTWRQRVGYSAIAFGAWDALYYVFLKVICDWPKSIFDWDILFLLPLPWWGPVFAPVCIALLMMVWGTLATQITHHGAVDGVTWQSSGLAVLGIALALYLFMADSLHVAAQGAEVLRNVLPGPFNWSAFLVALILMAAPVAETGWRLCEDRWRHTWQRFTCA